MSHPRTRAASFVVTAMLALNAPEALGAGPDWEAAEKILGRQAKVQPDGVRKFAWPRTDLRVTLDGVAIEPALALGSWAAFGEMPGGEVMAMGDLVLLGPEVNPVVSALQAGGVDVLAIHNHLIGEDPRILYLHFSGRGGAGAVAKALRAALEKRRRRSRRRRARRRLRRPRRPPSCSASKRPWAARARWPAACSRCPCRAPKRSRRTGWRCPTAWAWPSP